MVRITLPELVPRTLVCVQREGGSRHRGRLQRSGLDEYQDVVTIECSGVYLLARHSLPVFHIFLMSSSSYDSSSPSLSGVSEVDSGTVSYTIEAKNLMRSTFKVSPSRTTALVSNGGRSMAFSDAESRSFFNCTRSPTAA